MGELTWRGTTIAWAHVSALGDGAAPAFAAGDLAAMGERQLARHQELSGLRAAGFLVGRALIRELVLQLGGGPVVPLDSSCSQCGEDHAAPRTPGFGLSVSHADDLVAVAVSTGNAPVGVDIEPASAAARVAELVPMFAPGPVPDLAGWTRIEAAIKADGRGVAVDPAAVVLRPEPREPGRPPVWSATLPARAGQLQVATLAGPVGYTLSVARG